jgi:SAM-dependent methyltransferase
MESTHEHHQSHDDIRVPFTAAEWDARYASAPDGIWSGNPNPVLVDEIAGLTPGTALDVGCGEGADALWLAARGWQVTATDISTVALKRAAAHAELQALTIEWQQADLLTEAPPASAYDLVTAHYMHLPSALRRTLYGRLADAVSPGGTLLLVGHHPSDVHTSMPRPDLPDMFFTAEELAAALDPHAWDVLVTDARPRPARDPQGREITIRDTVLVARRKPL